VSRSFGTLLTGDGDNNDLVDIADFSLLRSNFGRTGPIPAP